MPPIFVTVGSTHFDPLIHSILSPPTLRAAAEAGFTSISLQYGRGTLPAGIKEGESVMEGLEVRAYRFTDEIEKEVEGCDLVVSHAGSGSIISALRAGKKLIVVPNTSLMDNHQAELADALEAEGYMAVCTPENLETTIRTLSSHKFTPFPAFQPQRFRNLVDETLGFPLGAESS